MNHVAFFRGGPLDGQWMQLPDPIPIFRVPMAPKCLPFALPDAQPGNITYRVGEYERESKPSRRRHPLMDPQDVLWHYLWMGVNGES